MKKMSFMLSQKRNTSDKSNKLKFPKQPTTSLCILSKTKTSASSTLSPKSESYKSPDKPNTSTSDSSLMYDWLYFRKNPSLNLRAKMNPPMNNTLRPFFNFTLQINSCSKNTKMTPSVNSRTLSFSQAPLFTRMYSMRINLHVFLLSSIRIS